VICAELKELLTQAIKAARHTGYYECYLCGRRVKRKYDLRIHLENLHRSQNDRACHCELCGKLCKNKDALRCHIYYRHKKNVTSPKKTVIKLEKFE
jgi:hypothetical protein